MCNSASSLLTVYFTVSSVYTPRSRTAEIGVQSHTYTHTHTYKEREGKREKRIQGLTGNAITVCLGTAFLNSMVNFTAFFVSQQQDCKVIRGKKKKKKVTKMRTT